MGPNRRRGAGKAAAAAAARRQWKVGDLVLAKVKGFPAWPATVSEPEKWGYPADWKKVLVYFFGTQQMLCSKSPYLSPAVTKMAETIKPDFSAQVSPDAGCFGKPLAPEVAASLA